MGRVYEAEHIELGRRVAVKVMRRKYADQKAMVERFRVEARSASKIGHPNVVQVFDFGTTDAGEGFIVMELLAGRAACREVIKQQGPMELGRTLAILGEVATALRAAHDSGVIHRDLKPANIFLIRVNADERERVRVLDFGMAKLIDLVRGRRGGLTAAGEILGTPEYMAPEQAVGGEIDRRIDVYALGCVAYEMWTGQPPFSGPNYVTVLAKHMDEKAPRISNLRDAPPALDQLVARALAKNPEDRPADMAAVHRRRSQRIAEDEGVQASVVPARALDLPSMPSLGPMSRMSSTKRRFTRMNRRTRRNICMAGGAILLLGVGAMAEQRFGSAAAAERAGDAGAGDDAARRDAQGRRQGARPNAARRWRSCSPASTTSRRRCRTICRSKIAGRRSKPAASGRVAHAAQARHLPARGSPASRAARRCTSMAIGRHDAAGVPTSIRGISTRSARAARPPSVGEDPGRRRAAEGDPRRAEEA